MAGGPRSPRFGLAKYRLAALRWPHDADTIYTKFRSETRRKPEPLLSVMKAGEPLRRSTSATVIFLAQFFMLILVPSAGKLFYVILYCGLGISFVTALYFWKRERAAGIHSSKAVPWTLGCVLALFALACLLPLLS